MGLICVGDAVLELAVRPAAAVARGGEAPAAIAVRAGGQALNVARVYRQLGGVSGLVAAVGQDAAAGLVLAELAQLGVVWRGVQVGEPTGTVVSVVEGQHRTMYAQRGANARLPLDEAAPWLVQPASMCALSGYLLLNARARQRLPRIVRRLRARRCVVAVDTPPADILNQIGSRKFLAAFDGADVLLTTEDEARALGGQGDVASQAKWLARHAACVVVKRGATGCWVYADPLSQAVPTQPLEEVDPTGAGDAFGAGFLFALRHRKGPVEAATFANRVAGAVISGKAEKLDCFATEAGLY